MKSQLTIDLGFLDPSMLSSEVTLADALSVLESYLENPTVNAHYIVSFLISRPHLFEFIVSALNEATFELLKEWIMGKFPTQADHYTLSLPSKIISSLSLSLLFVCSLSAEESADLTAYRRTVEHVPGVFAVLCSDMFVDVDTPDNTADAPGRSGKKKTQRENKQRKQRNTNADTKPFQGLGLRVPSTRLEAEELTSEVLAKQKDILQCYFQVLRKPALAESFRSAYVPVEIPACVQDCPDNDAEAVPLPAARATAATLPVAYPMVQPIKAALYFDSAEGFGDWRILISTRAEKNLRQACKREAKLFSIILKKIKELSRGHFSEDNHKQLTGPKTDIPIFEAKMTSDSRLVYQIDCVPEFESHVERQVIKIFGIYTHTQLDSRVWEGVGHQLGRKGKEYRTRCLFRRRSELRGDNVFTPGSWPPTADSNVFAPSTGIPYVHKDDLAQLHELLVLETYVTFSQAFLNSVLADKDVRHVFHVSMQEMEIIEHPLSCYVIGRSGTGKTTTMMFKMLGIERSYQVREGTSSKPRQLFVTQSSVLAVKVEEFFMKLLSSLTIANLSSKELAQIDLSRRIQEDRGMVDRDEEIAHFGGLPKRFSNLTDDHFPLFITFDQLCSLLEADLDMSVQVQPQTELGISDVDNTLGSNSSISTDCMTQPRATLLSYRIFREYYWTSFPLSLKKDLDPTLVFGEFMGVIKGSEKTLKREARYLDKETYINFSHRQQATFSSRRDAIYRLFELYSRKKRERNEYDVADRTHMILKRLLDGDLPGQQLDFIYVDEAQDNLLIDALILRMMCKNPNSGLFWAGDTAQTISIGSAFKFDDLKAFLYRVETSGQLKSTPRVQHPRSFTLAVNYRSHAGIVNCAHSIIELITHFWPYAIDRLAREKGMIDGNKPVFFSGWDTNTFLLKQFMSEEIGDRIEFGAKQCILVRDDDARARLCAQVGDVGIILTLYESKGLEFDDVLLYNFFEDSAANASPWRVVLNALTGSKDIVRCPQFDEVRHGSICRELKLLYVAITRARMNLWILDCSDNAEPMRLFWNAKNQIDHCTPGMDMPRLAKESTPKQWAIAGRELFDKRQYLQAMHCYERALLPREKQIAKAYLLREQALSADVYGMKRSNTFATAAGAFLDLAEGAPKEELAYLRISAKCYASSGDHGQAAKIYYRAQEFNLAAQQYRLVGMFDEAVAVVKLHRDAMDAVVVKNIVDVSRLAYLRDRKLKRARDLFESDQDALDYMDDFGFDITRTSLLQQLGRYTEAAEVHLAQGRTLEAIEVFSKDRQNPESIRRASHSLLDGMWRNISFGINFNPDPASFSDNLRGLLPLLLSLDVTNLEERTCDEVLMFRAIVSADLTTLSRLGEKFHNHHHHNIAAMMCLDRVFPSLPNLDMLSASDIANQLRPFLLYARLLQRFIMTLDLHSSELRRLFAFEIATEEYFIIPSDTLLFTYLNRYPRFRRRNADGGILILRWDLGKVIRDVLCERGRNRVWRDANGICHKARGSQPCLVFTVYGRHDTAPSACPREHIKSEFVDLRAYNLRVRIMIQQILIYHTIHMLETRWEETISLRRVWLLQLYEALYPSFYKMGGIHNLSTSLIPELEEGIRVVGIWTRELLHTISPYMPNSKIFLDEFLTNLLQFASLSFSFDPAFAHHELLSVHGISSHRPDTLLRNSGAYYVVYDAIACMDDAECNSLNRGVLFILHIIEQRIKIDIGVLFDFLDRLCAMLIVASQNRFEKTTTLHGITLPRSWLMRIARDFERLGSTESRYIFLYLRPMADLLEQIYTGANAAHLFFGRSNLSQVGFNIRNVFVLRLCKNLSLLGYNIRDVRRDVLQCITSIRRKPGRTFLDFNSLFRPYVFAEEWDALSWNVRKSAMETSLDEMILIHEASKSSATQRPPPYVRRIIYSVLDELPALLGSAEIPLSTLHGDVPPVTSVQVAADETNSGPESADDVEVLATGELHLEVDEAGDMVDQSLNVEEISLAIEQPPQTDLGLTDEELKAARIIRSVYRQHRRSRASPMDEQRGMMRRLYKECFDASATMEWSQKSLYRKLFLGALPHVLVSLERTREYLHSAKTRAKKRVKSVRDDALETMTAEISNLTTLLKKAIQLEKDLHPKSEVHKRRDLVKLKVHAQKVNDLVCALPPGAATEWREGLYLAMYAIVEWKEGNVAPKKPKPEINVEDDLLAM